MNDCYSDMPKRIVGVSGQPGHGKDTVADYLVSEFGFTKLAFAKILKDKARVEFGLTNEQLNGNLKEVDIPLYGKSPRVIMQELGCYYREIYKDFWVRAVLEEVNGNKKYQNGLVISDVRFPNEYNIIKQFGGKVVEVFRPGHVGSTKTAHQAERSMDDISEFDFEFVNDESLEKLYSVVKIFMTLWKAEAI